jgi:energy-coupling factor transporter ATP-binding protein EcfA2
MSKTFKAVNFMGIVGEAVITPTGNELIVLAGINGAGKSSFRLALQSIFKYDTKLIPDPIREGETESRAEFTDTELDVRLVRIWKLQADGSVKSTLSAFALDGAKYDKPADFVAKLIGAELIDPSQFVNYDEKKQREILLKKVTLPFDPDERAAKRKQYFDGRTETSRKVKELKAQIAPYPLPDDTIPTAEVATPALLAELRAIEDHNASVVAAGQTLTEAATERRRLEELGAALKAQLDQVREQFTIARDVEGAAATAYAALEVQSDVEITERLATVDATNAKVREQIARAKVAAALSEAEAADAAINVKIDAIDKEVSEGLAAAAFPFEGLSVTEDGVTVNGRAFASLNEAEQQFVAFEIATHGSPALKLLFLKNGNALDDSTLARIAARATEREWTIIAERGRDNSSEIGFVFDEGTLAVAA